MLVWPKLTESVKEHNYLWAVKSERVLDSLNQFSPPCIQAPSNKPYLDSNYLVQHQISQSCM